MSPHTAAPAPEVPALPGSETLTRLETLTRRLRLPYLRATAAEVLPTARSQRWDPAEVLVAVLDAEAAGRDRATITARRRAARFPAGKTFDAWRDTDSSIPLPTQQALRSLEWVTRAENLVICGPSGTGKSHFTEAIGHACIDAGLTVAWLSIEDLGALVRRHRPDDSLSRAIRRICRAHLLIVDDIGMLPVSPEAAEGLYRLVDAAYEHRSIALSSNLHPAGFDELMPRTLATATGSCTTRMSAKPQATATGSPKPPPAKGSRPWTETSPRPQNRCPPTRNSAVRQPGDPMTAHPENPLSLDRPLGSSVRT